MLKFSRMVIVDAFVMELNLGHVRPFGDGSLQKKDRISPSCTGGGFRAHTQ